MKKSTLTALLLSIMGLYAQTPTCPKTVGTELITNGSFSNGNTGFTSGYAYSSVSVYPGQYCISTNPNAVNAYFANIKDHTSGSGQMMVIDVDGTLGKSVYHTNVNISPNQTYFFSAWFSNINTNTTCPTCSNNPIKYENAPKLAFFINEVQVGGIQNVDSSSHNWQQFNIFWSSGPIAGPVTLSIKNMNSYGVGNDLALDDISFKASCQGIIDLSKLGKASTLPDTVYNCNEYFPYQLDTKLSNAKYAFNWYKGSIMESSGIMLDDQKTVNSTSSFSIAYAPANGTKYYVCYDSLGDGLTCPRLDSVQFRNEFNFDLGNSKTVCPPIYEVLSPSIGNAVSYQYQKRINGSFITQKTGTDIVAPFTITSAGTYRLSVIHNNPSCGSYTDTIRIDTLPNPQKGSITRNCNDNSGSAQLTVKTFGNNVNLIDGKVNISWFKTANGGAALANSTTETTVVNNSDLIITPSCTSGGLFLQDNNSFDSKIPMVDPCPTSTFSAMQPDAYIYAVNSSVPFDITSLKVFPKSFSSSGESISYQINLYNSTVPPNIVRTATPLYKSPVTTSIVSNMTFNSAISINIKGIEGIAAGSYYLTISAFQTESISNRELGSKTCSTTTANLQDPLGLIKITNLYEYANPRALANGNIFGIDVHIGKKSQCPRLWVCATCVVVTEQNDHKLEMDAQVFPNPAENQVTIDLKSKELYTYSLSNMYGQVVYSHSQAMEGAANFDVSSFSSGTYMLTIKTEGKSKTHLLVIQ